MENISNLADEVILYELQSRLVKKNYLIETQIKLVSELEKLNDRLRDVEQVKSGFLSNIRNEINNPLTAILGLSRQMISDGALSDPKTLRVASLINKEAFNLDFQLRNIFSAAEIEAGEVSVRLAMVNINELILDQISYFRPKAEQYNVTIQFQPIPNLYFKTDASVFNVIVMNLLSNAIEYSRPQSPVKIQCELDSQGLLLTVQDHGNGIKPTDMKLVFQRFVQLETGSTKTHQGHGLGLSIVKEFADLLNGAINVKSEVGVGTLIAVRLPQCPPDEVPAGFSPGGGEVLFDDGEVL